MHTFILELCYLDVCECIHGNVIKPRRYFFIRETLNRNIFYFARCAHMHYIRQIKETTEKKEEKSKRRILA